MLVVHHLGVSQSERILWLLEELELPYEIVHHTRAPLASPDSLKNVPGNITGKSPFLQDTDANVDLSESAAICEYIIHRYGGGRLTVKPSDRDYPKYLQYLHFANSTLQAAMVNGMFLDATGVGSDVPVVKLSKKRLHTGLHALDERLNQERWLAGSFSLADIMVLYCTSTQRYWGPQVGLDEYPNIVRWMQECGKRPAYQRAMAKGDPEMKVLLTAEPPAVSMMAAGGVTSSHWKK